MTTHLFSNTFCKLEILFKLQMLKKKNERKEGKEGGEHFEGQGDKCISSQARNAICSIDNTSSTI